MPGAIKFKNFWLGLFAKEAQKMSNYQIIFWPLIDNTKYLCSIIDTNLFSMMHQSLCFWILSFYDIAVLRVYFKSIL